MVRRTLVLLAVLIVVALGLVACGDDEEEATTTASESTESSEASGGGSVAISETEYALDPSEASAPAGAVTFTVTNDGEIPHNLEVEGEGVEEVTETIDGGASTELTVELQAGTYELYCSIADHQEQGMEGELTVE